MPSGAGALLSAVRTQTQPIKTQYDRASNAEVACAAGCKQRTPVMAVPDSAHARGSSGAGQTEMMYRDTANEVTAMATADHAFHMLRSNTWRERQIDPAANAQVSHL